MHWGRQLSLVSLGFSAFSTLHFLPKQGGSLNPLILDWVFLGGHPQAQSHLFRIFPKFLTKPSVSRTSSAPAEAKQMSPGHPTHVRKLAQAASFVMSTDQSEKLKTLDRCLLHPCIKEGAKLPDSGRSLRTRRHSRSQTSPREHKAAGYGNFPWQPDMPFTKAGELTAFCHSSVLGQFPKALCALPGGGSRPPRGTKGWGQPRLQAGATLLGSRLFPENP